MSEQNIQSSGGIVTVGTVPFANRLPFVLIGGPCQIESRDHAIEVATALHEATSRLSIPFVFKSSYDKANRTSAQGARGVGMERGLAILAEIRDRLAIPTLTDVHEAAHCAPAAQAVDILQIPAFLCRQTDLLLAAGNTGAAINVKKGQFLAPWDMAQVAAKIAATGNTRILLTERGSSFGYNTLVADMRALPIMAETGYPVVFDATHAVQSPGGNGNASGGDRRYAPLLARAALAVGVAAIFLEAHPDPDRAPSDGPNMVRLDDIPHILATLRAYDQVTKHGRDAIPPGPPPPDPLPPIEGSPHTPS